MTAKDPAKPWKVGACVLLTMFAAAFTSGISAQHYALPMSQLGDYLGNFTGGLLLYAAPGLVAAALFRSARASAYVATSGLVALVLISGAIATKTPYFAEMIGRRESASAPAPAAGPWTKYAKAPAQAPQQAIVDPYKAPAAPAATPKPANYFDRYDAPAQPAAANDGLPAGYKLIEPASAPTALGPAAAFELAATRFLAANCEFIDETNRFILQGRINEIASARPAMLDDDLLLSAAQVARAAPGFRAGAGCGSGVVADSSAAPATAVPAVASNDPNWDALAAQLLANNCEFHDPGNLQLLQEHINHVAGVYPTASHDWLLGVAAASARSDSRFKALSECPAVPAVQGANHVPAGNVVVAYDGTAEAAKPKKPACEYGSAMTDEEVRRCQQ